jgi:hypothetical protein
MPGPGGQPEGVEPLQLLGGEDDAVGRGVLLDAGDPSGAGDGSEVPARGCLSSGDSRCVAGPSSRACATDPPCWQNPS